MRSSIAFAAFAAAIGASAAMTGSDFASNGLAIRHEEHGDLTDRDHIESATLLEARHDGHDDGDGHSHNTTTTAANATTTSASRPTVVTTSGASGLVQLSVSGLTVVVGLVGVWAAM